MRKYLKFIGCCMAFFSIASSSQANTNEDNTRVYWQERSNGRVQLFADNHNPIPYWIKIDFTQLKNMRPSKRPPFTFVLEANSSKQPLLDLTPVKNKSYKFAVSSLSIPGQGPTTRHKDQHRYLLPFEHGKKYQLGQGYFGTATHQKPTPYALDFNMDIGTVICAARDGIVIEIKQDSNIGGPSSRYAQYANTVTIYHEDGSFANYAHLKKDGALVKKGQRVKAGQAIALSGNTGQSSGPHLHFEVFTYNQQGQSRNLPVKFITYNQQPLQELTAGNYYYSSHPNKPKFKVELGAKLSPKDITQRSPISFNDNFEISSENIDNTTVLYANNGTQSTVDMELELELQNLTSSANSRLKVSVPPLTKQFLTLLNPIDYDQSSQYGFSYKHQTISPAINDSDYAKHKKPVMPNNNIKINQQHLDDKVLLFAANGYNRHIKLTITLNITNLRPSKSQQLTIDIPPLTEVYLQHLEPIDSTANSKLGWALEWR